MDQKTTPITISIYLAGKSIGLKIFDYLNAANMMIGTRPIIFSFDRSPGIKTDLNILFVSMGSSCEDKNLDNFDLIFMSNNDEPLIVASDFIKKNISRDNAYLIANSFVTEKHHLADKLIFQNNDNLICRQYWTNAIFPQYHDNQKWLYAKKNGHMVFINGQNRSWRHHYVNLLQEQVPSIPIKSTWQHVINETNDAPWESMHDSQFREMVNSRYKIMRNQPTDYYDNSVKIKLISKNDGLLESDRTHSIPPGYFIMDEYWSNHCVIFPESNWLNNELSMTEKVFKCFFSKTLPFPIGGARINELYDRLGFITAWHLLPTSYQKFDQIEDHAVRAQMTVDAIQWLDDNVEIFSSELCARSLDQNFSRFLGNHIDHLGTDQAIKIIKSCIANKNIG